MKSTHIPERALEILENRITAIDCGEFYRDLFTGPDEIPEDGETRPFKRWLGATPSGYEIEFVGGNALILTNDSGQVVEVLSFEDAENRQVIFHLTQQQPQPVPPKEVPEPLKPIPIYQVKENDTVVDSFTNVNQCAIACSKLKPNTRRGLAVTQTEVFGIIEGDFYYELVDCKPKVLERGKKIEAAAKKLDPAEKAALGI